MQAELLFREQSHIDIQNGYFSLKLNTTYHRRLICHAHPAEVRLFERLFNVASPGTGDRDFLLDLDPHSRRTITGRLEPSLAAAQPEDRFQFERHGYFCADSVDSTPGAPVFNRAVTLKDSRGR